MPEMPEDAKLLADNIALLDALYPKMRIDCMIIRGSYFSPPVIDWLSKRLQTQPNMFFMAMPDSEFPHRFASLGGVRVITRSGSSAARAVQNEHLKQVIQKLTHDSQKLN
jgi:hypothetical protein